ncbi:MAG: hypothetical protein ACO2PN_23465 [Pyrobaculum sp.]
MSWLSSWSTKLRARPGPSDAPASGGGSATESLQKPPTRRLAEEVLKCGDAQCVLSYEGAAASAYWATLSSAFGVPGRSPEASDPL